MKSPNPIEQTRRQSPRHRLVSRATHCVDCIRGIVEIRDILMDLNFPFEDIGRKGATIVNFGE